MTAKSHRLNIRLDFNINIDSSKEMSDRYVLTRIKNLISDSYEKMDLLILQVKNNPQITGHSDTLRDRDGKDIGIIIINKDQ